MQAGPGGVATSGMIGIVLNGLGRVGLMLFAGQGLELRGRQVAKKLFEILNEDQRAAAVLYAASRLARMSL